MEYLLGAITIGIVALLAAMSPGPDFAVVTKNSILHARRAGIWTALGVGCGIFVHVAYSLVGIGLIISQSILLFSIIKYIGATYLLYLGWQLLRAKKHDAAFPGKQSHKTPISAVAAFREGFLTNALNPKATLFFLSIFTLIITSGTPLVVRALYGVEIAFIVGVWFVLLAYFLNISYVRNTFSRVQHYFERGMGAILIALGIKVALSTYK